MAKNFEAADWADALDDGFVLGLMTLVVVGVGTTLGWFGSFISITQVPLVAGGGFALGLTTAANRSRKARPDES